MATMNAITASIANDGQVVFTGISICFVMRFPITIDGIACTRIAIILIPSYTAAALTGEMVWTVLTLAAASVLAATEQTQRAVDSDHDDGEGGDHDDDGTGHDVDTDVETDVDTE